MNALAAGAYVALVATLVFNGSKVFGEVESVLIPMGMLSLFVLSAAVMGTIFFYQPIQLYLNGNKDEALRLFLSTLGLFAGVTAFFFLIAFLVSTL